MRIFTKSRNKISDAVASPDIGGNSKKINDEGGENRKQATEGQILIGNEALEAEGEDLGVSEDSKIEVIQLRKLKLLVCDGR